MKNRWLLAMIALVALAISCTLPFQRTSWTRITSVTVTPPVGEKDFSLKVNYDYTWDRDVPNAEIYCMYTSPGGSTIPIGTIVPQGLDRDRETFSRTAKLAFTLTSKDGKIEPGTYVAGCATEHDGSLVTAVFTVIGSAEPTSTPLLPLELAATPTLTPQTAVMLRGKIVFDIHHIESTRPSPGGDLDLVTKECVPEVTITPDGSVSGTCEKPHITARLIDESFSVQVTGQVDQDRNITFSYDVSEIGNPKGAWRITYEGQGKFTSAAQAAGTAVFSYSCNSGADNLIWCWKSTSESFSGTIPWSFVPSQ